MSHVLSPLSSRARIARFALPLLALVAPIGVHAEQPCPQPFRLTFTVEWHGFTAGTSVLELTRVGTNEYVYESRNTARGLFRLALPDTVTQTSHFSILNGEVVPTSYVGNDGSSDTSRDVSLRFDRSTHRITGTAENRPVDEPLQPGVQDPLSVQVALMCALAAGEVPKSFLLIDKDEVKEYQYTREGEAVLDTPLGRLDTVIYRSQKEGSSRATRLWIAPALGYLPVRAEQAKRGKREIQLLLRAAERLEPSAALTR